ncbi:MAG TPA: DUF6518 family protein [Mycobacteriales bacterium]|jgi:hypothetical protein|nr:DUF6518 family protein [Mycobacteriales bacterium]
MSYPRRWGAVVLAGLAVGAATALLQGQLAEPWGSLVNAASPWVTPAFFLGLLWRRVVTGMLAGAVACGLELAGYYGTDLARGYPVSHTEVFFWGICAIIGGPVFGAAGWAWWRGRAWSRGLGAAALPAAYLAEAAVTYGWTLHYWSSVMLFVGAGLVAIVLLGYLRSRSSHVAGWLLATFPVGVVAEVMLVAVTRNGLR